MCIRMCVHTKPKSKTSANCTTWIVRTEGTIQEIAGETMDDQRIPKTFLRAQVYETVSYTHLFYEYTVELYRC